MKCKLRIGFQQGRQSAAILSFSLSLRSPSIEEDARASIDDALMTPIRGARPSEGLLRCCVDEKHRDRQHGLDCRVKVQVGHLAG